MHKPSKTALVIGATGGIGKLHVINYLMMDTT